MANGQEQQPVPELTRVRVVSFDKNAKDEMLEVFLRGRAQLQTELKATGIWLLSWAMGGVGFVLILATIGVLAWLMCGSSTPGTERIVGCLVGVAMLLIAFLGLLLAFARATRSGSE